MSSKNIHILAQNTLDGAGAVLVIGWAYPDASVSFTIFNGVSSSFRSKFGNKNLSSYDIVFGVDLSIDSRDIPLIDRSNVICISKHNLTTNVCKNIKAQSSCTQTLYKLLNNKLDITTKQKQMLVYINDFISHTHYFTKSNEYNILFKNINLMPFVKEFVDGDKEFDEKQKAIISLHKRDISGYFSNLQKFKSDIQLKDSSVTFVGVFANKYINEIAELTLNQIPSCEVAFVFDTENNNILFRRSKKSTVDVETIVKYLCDGYGNACTGYGVATDKFLNFTKKFYPIDVD